MKPMAFDNINGFVSASISNERAYDINYLQKLFGHYSQEVLNNMVNMYVFKSCGILETCEQYAIAKAQQ
jgi:hypothetical protein